MTGVDLPTPAPTPAPAAFERRERLRATLRALGDKVTCGAEPPASLDRLSTGFDALDRIMGGGFVRGALNEVYGGAAGDGAAEALLPAVTRTEGRRLFTWVHPTLTPYPPALAQLGGDLSRWLLVRPAEGADHLFAVDLALKSGACDVVIAHAGDLSDRVLRRLQTAAEEGRCLGLLFRPAALAPRGSPAAVRLFASPEVAPDPRRRRVVFRVMKARGTTREGAAVVEWSRDRADERRVFSAVLPESAAAPPSARDLRRA
jgi:hypothetical protein